MRRALPFVVMLAGCLDLGPERKEPPRPPDAEDVTMEFCEELPALVAYKNDDYEWVAIVAAPLQRAFTFPARSRVTVLEAWGFDGGAGSGFSTVTIRNLSRQEANEFRCFAAPDGNAIMTGSVRNETGNISTSINMGNFSSFAIGSGSYSIPFLSGTVDLVAINRSLVTDTSFRSRVIVRHGITANHGVAMPELDFTGAEAKPLETAVVKRSGGGLLGFGMTRYETVNGTRVPMALLSFMGLDSTAVRLVPASVLQPGDRQRIDIYGGSHGVTFWQFAPKDTTISFGSDLSAVTIDTASSENGVIRLRARFASQAEYPTFGEVRFGQVTGLLTLRSIEVITSAAYLGGTPAQWELTVPDLRGVIPESWFLRTGAGAITWSATARHARPALNFGIGTPTAGETLRWASRSGG